MSCYNPICDNPGFPQGEDYKPYQILQDKGLKNFKDLFHKEAPWTPKTPLALQREYSLPHRHYQYSAKANAHWKTKATHPTIYFNKTIIDKLINKKHYPIAKIYNQ